MLFRSTHNYYLVGERAFTNKPCINDILIVEYQETELAGECEGVVLRSVEGDGSAVPIVIIGVVQHCEAVFDVLKVGKPDFQIVLGHL